MTTPSPTMGDRVLGRKVASQYRLRLASGPEDMRAAQSLRFLVFNVEMNEGLEEAYHTCLDADRFDAVCDHLLVEETTTGTVVGTYRLQTGTKALENLGYYSAQEFDFAPYESIRAHLVELGRACVHSEHRNLAVLGLLWKGIAAYARERNARYLIGCSSLPTVDEGKGMAAYREMMAKYLAPAEFLTQPVSSYRCSTEGISTERVKIPRLLTAYLSMGAKICGAPAVDREFGTIDFLTLLDLEELPDSVLAKTLM